MEPTFSFRNIVLVRLLVLVIALVSDHILPDHKAQGVSHFDYKPCSKWTSFFQSPFIKWDAIHYLDIARDGYQKDYQFAFFPLFPFIIRTFSRFLHWLININLVGGNLADKCWLLSPDDLLVISGIFVSNVSFIMSAWILHKLLPFLIKELPYKQFRQRGEGRHPGGVEEDGDLGDSFQCINDAALWIYCFNPASIFSSGIYTESFYSMLAWSAMLLAHNITDNKLVHKSVTFDLYDPPPASSISPPHLPTRHTIYIRKLPDSPLVNLFKVIACCLLFGLASCTRSNGIFNFITLLLLMYRLLFNKVYMQQYNNSLKTSCRVSHHRYHHHPSACFFSWRNVLLAIAMLIACATISIGPSIIFDYTSKQHLCSQLINHHNITSTHNNNNNNNNNNNSNSIILYDMSIVDIDKSTFCAHGWAYILALFNGQPTVYSLVQRRYWNVGFLRFYRFKQLPNFLIGLPILAYAAFHIAQWVDKVYTFLHSKSISTSTSTTRTARRYRNKPRLINWIDKLNIAYSITATTWSACIIILYSPHTLHLVCMSLIALLWAHVQISTRLLLSSCPILYLTLAYLLINNINDTVIDKKQNVPHGHSHSQRSGGGVMMHSYNISTLTRVYVIVYFLIGIIAHVNWLPWT